MRWLAILIFSLLTACSADRHATSPERAGDAKPVRIVSLDYCADQYVLKLVDRDRIAAVSRISDDDYSYMRDAAAGLRKVRPVAEDVLALEPDLIVRTYGGGPEAAGFFEAAGVPVLQIGFVSTLADIRTVLTDAAAGLDEEDRGAALLAEYDRRVAALAPADGTREALYVTSGGVTAGPGTLIDEMFRTAGYDNFQTEPGWQSLPLERLAYDRPDLIAAAFFESGRDFMNSWSASGHPVIRRQMADVPVVQLDGAWTSCGGWFLIEAMEALAEADGAEGGGA